MKAWQINDYGSIDVFQLKELPDPMAKEGWVLIDIKAFGLNRSELYTRQGHSGDAVTIPRVLGIECVGVVIDGGGTDLKPGQKVAAAMGKMGRLHDGGYAEKTLLPRSNVFPVKTNLSWEVFGALPETYLTAWGAVIEAINLQKSSSILIRGGSSAAGLACTSIAKDLECKVIATTRSEQKKEVLLKASVDHVIIENKNGIEKELKEILPNGVAGVVELVGLENTIIDSLYCTAPKGTVCMVGFLGNHWDYKFFPWMPPVVNLTRYSSETIHEKRHTAVLQQIVNKVEDGTYKANLYKTFSFKELHQAHDMMENNKAIGKLVVLVD